MDVDRRIGLWFALSVRSTLGLGNDEAYHFLYAAHPALSYYDHPPMMAWVEMAGLDPVRGRRVGLGDPDRLHPAFWGLDVAAGAA